MTITQLVVCWTIIISKTITESRKSVNNIFITEEAKETVLDSSQETVDVF